jgi:isoleucyl-tRNA synthetase
MNKRINKISNFVKFPQLEKDITAFWKDNNTFVKSLKNREGHDRFSFMDGPPFVSGSPHFGSLIPSIAKDVIPRFQTMKGKYVRRVFGWDCHGLPIEEKVSAKLGLKNRDEIEAYGVKQYIEECRAHVHKCTSDWRYYIDAVGRWVDMDNAYYTMNPEFNESVLWVFKKAWDKGLIYKGNRVSLYSIDNQTPVSEFEVNMDPSNYRDVTDIAVYVKFPLTTLIEGLEAESQDAQLVIWTTTPWTIPAHLCMAYNPDLTYVIAQFEGQKYILAESRILDVFQTDASHVSTDKGSLVQVLSRFEGTKLKGLQYSPVYTHQIATNKHFQLYPANYVTDQDGTGLVHIAKYGKEDIELCNKYSIETFDSITQDGIILDGAAKGLHMRKALEVITEEILNKGKLLRSHSYTHRLPFYRGDSPLIYLPQDSYFINVQKLKPRMLELNQQINWFPAHLKNGRFLDVIDTAPDWCISRTRFWATIMPLWVNDDGETIVCGSVDEIMVYTDQIIKTEAGYELNGQKFYLHRDFCDQIILTKEGKKYKRVDDVLDCWLDSGSVPFAEFSYPFHNEKEFQESKPADYIIEYTGQLRAWFNMLLRVSVIAFDELPFKNAVVTGNMAGNDGRKMSKSFGNYPDPRDILENIGGEALRLQLMESSVMLGDDASWSDELLNDQVKNVIIPFWNTFTYFTIYADLHNYTPVDDKYVKGSIMDDWLESRVNLAIKDFDEALTNYNMPQAVKTIRPVIDDISTWYIRRSRDRFAAGDKACMQNLYASLIRLIKAFAPQMVFVTERMYQEIVVGILPNAQESVHLEDYPIHGNINHELLTNMSKLRDLCSLGLAIRSENGLAVRQPLSLVATDLVDEALQSVLKDELNCKEVIYTKDFDNLISKTSENGTVAINIELTKELQEEGQLADLTRKVQNARKNVGMTMGQQAKAYYSIVKTDETDESLVIEFLTKYNTKICETTALVTLVNLKEVDPTDFKQEKIKFLAHSLILYFDIN